MINNEGIVIIKKSGCTVKRTAEKQTKRMDSLKKFHCEVGKKARENERRAARSLEYARHAIVK